MTSSSSPKEIFMADQSCNSESELYVAERADTETSCTGIIEEIIRLEKIPTEEVTQVCDDNLETELVLVFSTKSHSLDLTQMQEDRALERHEVSGCDIKSVSTLPSVLHTQMTRGMMRRRHKSRTPSSQSSPIDGAQSGPSMVPVNQDSFNESSRRHLSRTPSSQSSPIDGAQSGLSMVPVNQDSFNGRRFLAAPSVPCQDQNKTRSVSRKRLINYADRNCKLILPNNAKKNTENCPLGTQNRAFVAGKKKSDSVERFMPSPKLASANKESGTASTRTARTARQRALDYSRKFKRLSSQSKPLKNIDYQPTNAGHLLNALAMTNSDPEEELRSGSFSPSSPGRNRRKYL